MPSLHMSHVIIFIDALAHFSVHTMTKMARFVKIVLSSFLLPLLFFGNKYGNYILIVLCDFTL